MCGIIAYAGDDDATNRLLTGLDNLDYRGYDSAGIAVKNGTGIAVEKRSGRIDEVERAVERTQPTGDEGIGHTRWSTHGPPTDENAHPHTCDEAGVAVVHNGIIENHETLRTELRQRGHEFTSDTDTEVVPHLIAEHLASGDDATTAFRRTLRRLEGSYAIAAVVEGTDGVFASRQGSPLVLGLDDGDYYLASDVPAFLEYTDEVIYLESNDVVSIQDGEATITDVEGEPVSRSTHTVDWDSEEASKGAYDHFMRKEIDAQPNALANAIRGRVRPEGPAVELDGFGPGTFADVDFVQLVGCGTSYHAALYAENLLDRCGVSTRAIRASEYDPVPASEETLVVAVTQSGETADTLDALRQARDDGARTLAVTNVMGSTAAREADDPLYIRAGPEIGVAATKTFSGEVVTLAMLVERLADDVEGADQRDDQEEFLRALRNLPDHLETVLDESQARRISDLYADQESYFFIGNGAANPVALEGALKFKEITYEHAEGFASGELKHGPLALVTSETVLVPLLVGNGVERTVTNAQEARSRGATVLGVTTPDASIDGVAEQCLTVPETHPDLVGILANVQLQLLSYHTADILDRSIDKPRNLAKSVTVK